LLVALRGEYWAAKTRLDFWLDQITRMNGWKFLDIWNRVDEKMTRPVRRDVPLSREPMPDRMYYFVIATGGDATIEGPFATAEERDAEAERTYEEEEARRALRHVEVTLI
jgi:hypothetical protein